MIHSYSTTLPLSLISLLTVFSALPWAPILMIILSTLSLPVTSNFQNLGFTHSSLWLASLFISCQLISCQLIYFSTSILQLLFVTSRLLSFGPIIRKLYCSPITKCPQLHSLPSLGSRNITVIIPLNTLMAPLPFFPSIILI